MKLFSDNQLRAEEAVSHLRQQLEGMRDSKSPPRRGVNHSGKEVPCLFPASSPKHKRDISVPNVVADPPSRRTAVNDDVSFDDGVSAISQETLEEMAKLYLGSNGFLERVHSDVTQQPVDAPEESWKHTVNPNRRASPTRQGRTGMSPLRLTRQGRSQGTINTKQSRHTTGTKSTMSTQTHEFATAWRKDEEQYWQDMVKEDEDPAESVGISSRHEKLIRIRDLRRQRSKDVSVWK